MSCQLTMIRQGIFLRKLWKKYLFLPQKLNYAVNQNYMYLMLWCTFILYIFNNILFKNVISGNNEKPIIYHVDRTRDGQTYTSRNIKATQEGIPIFTMQASFKVDEVDPLEHQFTMPVVPDPEELISSMQYIRNRLE